MSVGISTSAAYKSAVVDQDMGGRVLLAVDAVLVVRVAQLLLQELLQLRRLGSSTGSKQLWLGGFLHLLLFLRKQSAMKADLPLWKQGPQLDLTALL